MVVIRGQSGLFIIMFTLVAAFGFTATSAEGLARDADVSRTVQQQARSEALFAYGTLLDSAIQQRLISRVVPSKADVLPGYRIGDLKLTRGTYRIAEPAHGHQIDGGVMWLTSSELRRFDAYEGPHYERARVVLESGIEAWVYRAPQ